MGRVPDFRLLEDALLATGKSLHAGDGPAKAEILRDVFRMNHEMGRMARGFPALAPSLREMQLEVNSMTVHIKREERGSARVALEKVTSCLGRVKDAQAAASQN